MERDRLPRPLPAAVRQRVVEIAARCLGTLAPDEVPTPLRRVARFEPRRRARLAATSIAAQVESDEEFRKHVADHLRGEQPGLADALHVGTVPAAADPVVVAAAAYLLRPAGWEELVEQARDASREAARSASDAATTETIKRLKEQVAAAKAETHAELDRLRRQARESRTEVAELRRKLHDARHRTRTAEAETERLRAACEEERTALAQARSTAEADLRRLRSRLADAEQAVEAARRTAREGRNVDDVRLRVLLDALVEAAQGLRREMALPPALSRPADRVTALSPGQLATTGVSGRALDDDDPVSLDHMLALPQVHLIVDGYNVTKAGYGTLPLETQRTRLLSGLGALAAQTRAEITCVFDGAQVGGSVSATEPRGVRVRFSLPGEPADDLIRRLVLAEPRGRPIVVVSSDREVADHARRLGARPLPGVTLLRRLDRA